MPASRTTREAIEKWLPLNTMDFLVLAVLSDGERHGYGIVKDIEARTNGKVRMRPGNLYRIVDRLMDRGFVEARSRRQADPSPGARRHYGITALGTEILAAQVRIFVDVVSASGTLKGARGFAGGMM